MSTFSYSMYSALKKCGKYYDLRYLQNVPEPGPQSSNLAFGTAVHSGVNAALTGEDGVALFEMFWDTYANKDLEYDRFNHEQLKELGVRFITNFTKRYVCKMRLIMGEERLKVQFHGIDFEGTPDAVVEYEGKNYLVDFKTTAYAYDRDKVRSSLQLNLYAQMVEVVRKIRIDGLMYLCFVKGTGAVQTPIIEEFSHAKATTMLLDMVQDIKANEGTLVRNPNSCFMGRYKCAYFDTCWPKNK